MQLVSDACTLINLIATRRAPDILRAAGVSFVTPAIVAAQVKRLEGPLDEEGNPTSEVIDLSELKNARLLTVEEFPDSVIPIFVACAERVRDADAACIALAAAKSVGLVTDDGKLRRVARSAVNDIELLWTLQIVRTGVEALTLNQRDLRALALDMRTRARFAPPRNDPDAPWMTALLAD